ncbi:MAG: hypothetical protein HKN19_12680 [Halioglobus sp.]|nr:hypothetical protein [Halioglobus sp.]
MNKPVRWVLCAGLALLASLAHAQVSVDGRPRVLVLFDEKVMGILGTTGWEVPNQTELTLIELLRSDGFVLLDPQTLRRNIDRNRGLRLLEGDQRAATATGLAVGAELSILGTAISKPAGAKLFGTQMQSIQATVTARVVLNDTGEVVGTATATAAKASLDEVQGGVIALEEATKKLAADLLPQLLAATDRVEEGARGIEVTIAGLKSYRQLDYLLYFFETEVDGMTQVYLRDFTNTVATVRLEYDGTSQVLARKVARESFKGFRLEPTEVTSNQLQFSVIGSP